MCSNASAAPLQAMTCAPLSTEHRCQQLARLFLVVYDEDAQTIELDGRGNATPYTGAAADSGVLYVLSRMARMGSVTVKVAPCPSPLLCASTVPPCNSTKWRTIATPTQPAMAPFGTRVGLAEAVEYERQKLRADADSRIAHRDSTCDPSPRP